MPCPHYSRENSECALMDNAPEDEEDSAEAPVEEPVNGEWCLAAGNGYRSCPIYRKFLAELLH